jgi:hypothetical protein
MDSSHDHNIDPLAFVTSNLAAQIIVEGSLHLGGKGSVHNV